MKKSVILMAGFMAMALAGSAQAATMFAVQNSGAVDQATISDIGTINTNGHITTNNPSAAGGWIGVGTAAPAAPFHVQVSGNQTTNAAFIYQFTNSGSLGPIKAPNFSFMRNNDPLASGVKNVNDPSLPRANDMLGIIQFGTVIGAAKTNMAAITAKAEGDSSAAAPNAYMFFFISLNNVITERLRINSAGSVLIGHDPANLPVGTLTKLNVVGLPVFTDNTAATTGGGGLAPGALYRTGSGVLMVAF
jgi:hypothetical protein